MKNNDPKIVVRPGAVWPYPKIENYDFRTLIHLIAQFQLSRHDWIITTHDDAYIYGNWQYLFNDAESQRIIYDLKQLFGNYNMTVDFKHFTSSEFERAKTKLEVEFYEGLMELCNYNMKRAGEYSGLSDDTVRSALQRLGLFEHYKERKNALKNKNFNYESDSVDQWYLG